MHPIFARVRAIVTSVLKIADPDLVGPDANLIEDLGADNLDLCKIFYEIEEAFGNLSITADDEDTVRTVSDLSRLVKCKQSGTSPHSPQRPAT